VLIKYVWQFYHWRLLCSVLKFRFSKASSDKKQLDVGANLFIGNLDDNVDERLLYDTFSSFGMMATTAKVLFICLFVYTDLHFSLRRSPGIRKQVNQKDTVLSPL
jgi:RNA recognition motif-containing protein